MEVSLFPVIDPERTGKNIVRLRKERNLTVRDIQEYFGFEEPQAVYKWQRGKSLPSLDNLFALAHLFHVSMDEIIVPLNFNNNSHDWQEIDASLFLCHYVLTSNIKTGRKT